MTRLLKVATPWIAFTVVVPWRVPAGPPFRVRLTAALEAGTVAPFTSWTTTVTPNGVPAIWLVGCTEKASFTGGLATAEKPTPALGSMPLPG